MTLHANERRIGGWGRKMVSALLLIMTLLGGMAFAAPPAAADDGDVNPYANPYNKKVNEGDSAGTTLFLKLPPSANISGGDLTMEWETVQTNDGSRSATAGVDYVVADGRVGGARPYTNEMPIRILGDNDRELNEKFRVRVVVTGNLKTEERVFAFDITIEDDDEADQAGLWVDNLTLTEGDTGTSDALFSIRRDGPSDRVSSASWTTLAGSALSGSDFLPMSGTVSFGVGESLKTVAVPVVGDLTAERNGASVEETFRLVLSKPVNAAIVSGDRTTLLRDLGIGKATIIDNDQRQGIGINDVKPLEGSSGSKDVTFTVTRYGANTTSATVTWATSELGTPTADPSDPAYAETAYPPTQAYQPSVAFASSSVAHLDKATAGTDYTTRSGTLTFTSGQKTKTITVPVRGDTAAEADEGFAVKLTAGAGATLLEGRATGFATIVDDDPGLAATDEVVREQDDPLQPITFTIHRTGGVNSWSQVNWDTRGGTAGSADLVGDFGTVYFAPGESSREVPLKIRGDLVPEADETFYVDLSEPSQGQIRNATASITIEDDDGISIDGRFVNEDNPGTSQAVFDVKLTGPAAAPVSVTWTAVPDLSETSSSADPATPGAGAGRATPGADFEAVSGTVTFAPGEVLQQVQVPVLPDALTESDETFAVELSDPVGPARVVESSAVAAIRDFAPGVTITWGMAVEGNDGTTTMTFTVDRIGTEGSASVAWATGAQVVTNPIPADPHDANPYDVPTTEDGNDLPKASPASEGSDYTAADGTLSFAPGEATKTISVTILGDVTPERHERFNVALSNPVGTTVIGSGHAQGVILADDSGLAITDVAVAEGESGTTRARFQIDRTSSLALPTTVSWATVNGTAIAPGDLAAASGTVTFATGETRKWVDVNLVGDTAFEPTETFTVRLSGATNGTITDADGTGTITNDDGISVANTSMTEPRSGTARATFTVTLSRAATSDVTVRWATAGALGDVGEYSPIPGELPTRPATSGSDFVAGSGTLTFARGQTSRTIAVTVKADTQEEPTEGIRINLSASTGAAIIDGTAYALINNYRPGIRISAGTLVEGASGTRSMVFTVTRDGDLSKSSTISYTTKDDRPSAFTGYACVQCSQVAVPGPTPVDVVVGSATAGEDYTATSGTLTFARNQSSKTISVPITGDTKKEDDERFYVLIALENRSPGPIVDSQGDGLIQNDD